MKLHDALNANFGKDVKVGMKDGSGFIYCGKAEDMNTYFNREVVEIYPSVYGGNIIIIEGDEVGKFWTKEEYQGVPSKPLKASELNTEGCMELANAIYEDSADSLIYAVIGKKESNPLEADEYNHLIKMNIDFLTSGLYMHDAEMGQHIVEKVMDEIDVAYDFIDDFVKGGEGNVLVNPKMISYKILKNIIRTKQVRCRILKRKCDLKLKTYKGNIYLEKVVSK